MLFYLINRSDLLGINAGSLTEFPDLEGASDHLDISEMTAFKIDETRSRFPCADASSDHRLFFFPIVIDRPGAVLMKETH